MNRQPIIGVTPLVDTVKESYWMLPGYFNGILQAGGLPLMLPLTTDASRIAQLCHLCDGILLTGGQDIQPELYGAEPLPCCGECSPERDTMELQLLELAGLACFGHLSGASAFECLLWRNAVSGFTGAGFQFDFPSPNTAL